MSDKFIIKCKKCKSTDLIISPTIYDEIQIICNNCGSKEVFK